MIAKQIAQFGQADARGARQRAGIGEIFGLLCAPAAPALRTTRRSRLRRDNKDRGGSACRRAGPRPWHSASVRNRRDIFGLGRRASGRMAGNRCPWCGHRSGICRSNLPLRACSRVQEKGLGNVMATDIARRRVRLPPNSPVRYWCDGPRKEKGPPLRAALILCREDRTTRQQAQRALPAAEPAAAHWPPLPPGSPCRVPSRYGADARWRRPYRPE